MYCKRCKEKKSSKLTDFARWNKILLKWKLEFLTVLKSSEIWFSPLSYWTERNPDLSHSIYFEEYLRQLSNVFLKIFKKKKKKEIDTQQYIASRYVSVSSHSEEHWSLYFKSHLSETKSGVALINRWLRSKGYSFCGGECIYCIYYTTLLLIYWPYYLVYSLKISIIIKSFSLFTTDIIHVLALDFLLVC